MAMRIGIELSRLACRIVELDGDIPETRVRSFAVLPANGAEMAAKLASLRGREVAVVIWGVGSDHRQVIVGEGGYEAMRAEAIASAREAGVQTEGMAADIAPEGAAVEGAGRRPVMLTLASSAQLTAAVRPLVEAGLRIRSVVTAPAALTSLARTRRAFTAPGSIEVYVALEETETAVALIRDGALLAARDLPWGYLDDDGPKAQPRRRDDLALKLADDLTAFLSTVGAAPGSMKQLLVCGGLPELRSMTVPLMERLDVEVETLDSLLGIDAVRLPEADEEFRERAAELRLAWAVAADGLAPINLMRARQRSATKTVLARAAVAAGVVAGLVLGWGIQRSDWWKAKLVSPVPAVRVATPPEPMAQAPSLPKPVVSAPVEPAPAPPSAPPPAAIAPASAPPAERQVVPAPVVAERRPTETPQPRPVPFGPPARASVAVEAPRIIQPPPPVVVAPAPRTAESPQALVTPPPAPRASEGPAARPARRTAAPPVQRPLPFDGVLGTILFSADRKLAIVDGRIVGAGDQIKGARVVEITANSVLLRDGQGRMRILTLGASGR